MDNEHYREQIELLLYDELGEKEREETNAHMQSCIECRTFYDELKKFHGVLAQYSPVQADNRMLSEARAELQSALRDEHSAQSFWERLESLVLPAFAPQYKIALGGVATIVLGFFLGYLAFKSPVPQPREQAPRVEQAVNEPRPVLPEGGQISNVKFIDSGTKSDEVEFTFDAVMPMHLKGRVNDPQIQQVLSYALLNEQNPGTRLHSVNAIASEHVIRLDEDVKKVLITALKSDDNPGVRKEALNALQKFPFDNDVKKALMNALAHDSNSAIRIDAINALKSASAKDIAADQDLLNIFKEKVKSDNNPYVRIRAKAALQEISQ